MTATQARNIAQMNIGKIDYILQRIADKAMLGETELTHILIEDDDVRLRKLGYYVEYLAGIGEYKIKW